MSDTLLAPARARDDAAPGPTRQALAGAGIPTIGLGCSRLGSITNTDPAAGPRLIALALELGIAHFDTSDIYGQGDSERLLGRVLRGRRDHVLLASKGGRRFSPALGRAAAALKAPLRPATSSPALGRALRRPRRPAEISARPFSSGRSRTACGASAPTISTSTTCTCRRRPSFAPRRPPRSSAAGRRASCAISASRSTMRPLRYRADWPGLSVVQAPLSAERVPGFAGFLAAAADRGVAVIARERSAAARGWPALTARRPADFSGALRRPRWRAA
ncbi:MAG: aldo/keto reductase [Dongiaceae bacterium]